LRKRKSLFEDPSIQIQKLTENINQDIRNLNQQIDFLEVNKPIKKNKQTAEHTTSILKTLKTRLKNATKSFGQILEVRTDSLKTQEKERQQYTPALHLNRIGESNLFNKMEEESKNNEVAITIPDQQISVLQNQDRYLESRADAVIQIEKTITELQGIFQHLATLVVEQGEMIERIDTNIYQSESNVNNAQKQLLKYLSSVSSNRWLMLKLFGILLVFIVIFIVFFV